MFLSPAQLASLEENVRALKEICSLESYKASKLARGSDEDIYAYYLQNLASFRLYARTLRKTPSEKLYHQYLLELASKHQSPVTKITTHEKKRVEARKIWSDFVSSVYRENQDFIQQHDIKTRVAERLRVMGVRDIDKTYEDCLTYLRERSVVTVTFDASIFFHNGLDDVQLLNIHESLKLETDPENHKKRRFFYEEYYASRYLKEPLRTHFITNLHSRMRYGAVKFLDTRVEPTDVYGRSFIVLKDVVKLNSVFVPGDSLEVGVTELCTIHNLELLLLLTEDKILRNILDHIDADHPANDVDCVKNYIEVMLPAVDILDENLVEHIYIDSSEYMLTQDELKVFQHVGIKVTNIENPKHEPQIKSAKLDAIKAALECIASQHSHQPDRDAALYSIKEQIRTIKQIGFILPYLSTSQRALLLDILIDDLPAWIQSGRDFSLILHYLTEERRSVFAESMLPQLSDIIQSGYDFHLANEYLSEMQSTIFLNAILPRLPCLIRSGSGKDLSAVLRYLTRPQAETFLLTIQTDLPGLFQSSQDFADVLDSLWYEELVFLLVNGLQKKLPLFMTSIAHVVKVLNSLFLNKQKCYLFIDAMMADFPRLITSFNDYKRIYWQMGEDHRLIFIQLMTAQLPDLIISSEQCYQGLDGLSRELHQTFFDVIKNKFSELVISPESLINVVSVLEANQYQEFYNCIKKNYPTLIPSLNVFGQVLTKLHKSARQSFVDSMLEQLPSLIPPGQTLIAMLNELDEGAVVVDAMFDKYPSYLAASGTLFEILYSLDAQLCTRVLSIMQPPLSKIFQRTNFLLIGSGLFHLNDRHPLNILHYLFLNHSLEIADRFYHALLNHDDETIKNSFDTLIKSTMYKYRPLRLFINQSSIDQLIDKLADMNISWLKTMNLTLKLDIQTDGLENKNIVVLALKKYAENIKPSPYFDTSWFNP